MVPGLDPEEEPEFWRIVHDDGDEEASPKLALLGLWDGGSVYECCGVGPATQGCGGSAQVLPRA